MMKHLWLYPLIFAIMTAAILGCALRIGWLLYEERNARSYEGARLVWEVADVAQI